MNHDQYYRFLLARSRLSFWYRRLYLYPKICKELEGKVLDVGCGIGDFLRFRPNTVGVDINPYLVEHCRRLGLEVHAAHGPPLPFADAAFTGAVMDNVLEHIADPLPMLLDIRRLLAPRGDLVIGVPGRKGFDADPDHKRFYDEVGLCRQLRAAGFECRTIWYTPFRAAWLDRRIRQYAMYGEFSKMPDTALAATSIDPVKL